MTSKKDFLAMDCMDKSCVADVSEECKAKSLLVECNCVPWEMPGFEVKFCQKVKNEIISPQKINKCSTKGRDCIEKKSNATFNCQTSCQGIYADITQWDEEYTMETTKYVMQPLMTEYEKFKGNNVKHVRFNSSASATVYGT